MPQAQDELKTDMCCVGPRTVLLAMSFWHRPSTSTRWVPQPLILRSDLSAQSLKKLCMISP